MAEIFTTAAVEAIYDTIWQCVEHWGGELQRAGTIEFVAQCAYPLSSLVISNLLGLPAEYHQIFREASAAIARFPTSVLRGDFAQVVHSAVCLKQAETVLENLICQRRATPGADLISRLANEGDAAVRLSNDKIIVLCSFLITSGNEMVARALAGSLFYLLSERRRWVQLLEEPKLLENATSELLRFISPILWVSRTMTRDIELDGNILRKGSKVKLGIAAANRDPSEFKDPDILNLARSKPHSPSFICGSPFSVGLAVAQIEIEYALAGLLHRMPDIALESRVIDCRNIHHPRTLPLTSSAIHF
jgi:cytochrome P450